MHGVGQERYESISPIYYRGADIVLVVFSPFVDASWTRARKWLEDIPVMVPDAKIVVVSTMHDLVLGEKELSLDVDAEGFAVAIGCSFAKTSAVSGAGIEALLDTLWSLLDELARA
jgi:GTPase SAR1 family protein